MTHYYFEGRGEVFFFFWLKSPLAAAAAMAVWRDKKVLRSFLAAVLLSALVERCFVSRGRDFFCLISFNRKELNVFPANSSWRINPSGKS